MISNRYAPAACVLVALALVPTIIHSYAHAVVSDGRSTANISPFLNGFSSAQSGRDAGWGERRFKSFDWIERRYRKGDSEVLLTVLRSYDLKRLYHHPELDIAYGMGYLKDEVQHLPSHPEIPLHVLSTDADRVATAVYTLHYGEGFVEDPIAIQVRTAATLLASPRRPMTLVFARDIQPTRLPVETFPSTQVLFAAVDSFVRSNLVP